MKIGGLFSGIGGLELGLERAGVGRTVWQVEKDEWCRRVLAKHWPDAIRYEDVTEMDWSQVEPVEVLCGGFPCQDISLAGLGAGMAGERSGLWREYARAIRELRPRFVVVENVSALLARGLGDVLGDLAACGYDTEWDCIPAAAVGAPHRRDRVFVIAHADQLEHEGGTSPLGRTATQDLLADPASSGPGREGEGDQDPRLGPTRSGEGQSGTETGRLLADAEGFDGERSFPEGDRRGRPEAAAGDRGPCVADPDGEAWGTAGGAGEALPRPGTLERSGRCGGSEWGYWTVEPDVGRVAYGVPRRVDRLRGLGNAVVPQVAEVVGRRLMELAG